MSRLRADIVVNKDANGPFEAGEGIDLASTKNIIFRSGCSLVDENLNDLLKFPSVSVSNAVNEITISNSVTNTSPSISATGSDTNISLNLQSKGTGTVKVNNDTVVTLTASQTLTNKTLTSPVISNPTFAGVTFVTVSDTQTLTNKTLTNPTIDNPTITNSDLVTLSGTQTLLNKTLTSPTINGGTLTVNSLTVNTSFTLNASAKFTALQETVVNNFITSLTPVSGTLFVDVSAGTIVLGDISASVTTWAFTNVPTVNGMGTTVTLIIDGDTAQTYGDACLVNGVSISGGVKWSGGNAPTATNNFDLLTFAIIRDNNGNVNVFGSATTNFS